MFHYLSLLVVAILDDVLGGAGGRRSRLFLLLLFLLLLLGKTHETTVLKLFTTVSHLSLFGIFWLLLVLSASFLSILLWK